MWVNAQCDGRRAEYRWRPLISGKYTSVVRIARVSHSAFTSLLDHCWTNSFSGDIC